MMKYIIRPLANDDSILPFVTINDLHAEIRKLQREVTFATDELTDFRAAHARRPYSQAYAEVMTGGFEDSIRELQAQIRKVRGYLGSKVVTA